MMKDPENLNEEKVCPETQGIQGHADRPSGQDRQEQYQRTREHAASDQEQQDRDARIRRRAHQIWEQEGQPEGFAEQHWQRAAQELDREDAEIQSEGFAGEGPGAKRAGSRDEPDASRT